MLKISINVPLQVVQGVLYTLNYISAEYFGLLGESKHLVSPRDLGAVRAGVGGGVIPLPVPLRREQGITSWCCGRLGSFRG